MPLIHTGTPTVREMTDEEAADQIRGIVTRFVRRSETQLERIRELVNKKSRNKIVTALGTEDAAALLKFHKDLKTLLTSLDSNLTIDDMPE